VSAAARVGLISDTHGTVAAGALEALAGVDRILHAGDVGSPAVIAALERIAPVVAVRGNTDHEGMFRAPLPPFAFADVRGVRFAVTHIRGRAITIEQARRRGCDVYVFGHTHVAEAHEDDGLWIVNPGSASRPRGGSAQSVAVVDVSAGVVLGVELVTLD
jgi:uncharacterized protein